jgi:crotonobetaine/carnitine-CoA ligase
MYTSGTTGTSKGVLCSWAYLSGAPGGAFPDDSPVEDGAYYSPWQPYHLTSRTALQIAVQMDLRLVMRRRFSVSMWWDDIRAYNCTHVLCAFLGAWLWNQPPTDRDADNPLRRMAMSPLIKEFREFEQRFGVEVTTTYASVEAGFAIEPPRGADDHRICGHARPGFEVRIVDEHDEEVPVGERGELVIRSDRPWLSFGGYLNDPASTATVLRNGWVHTGDAFTRDEAGNLYFVDRMKDYIKYRGQTISTAEIEAAVSEHPDVVECACVGYASDLAVEGAVGGDDIRVFVVTKNGGVTAEELHLFLVEEQLPRSMVPRYLDFVEELPKNHVNKILKQDLRDRPVTDATWDRERVVEPQ